MINEDWSFFKFRKDNMGKVLGFEYRSDNSIYEFDKNL
jgi:hypothetical protein